MPDPDGVGYQQRIMPPAEEKKDLIRCISFNHIILVGLLCLDYSTCRAVCQPLLRIFGSIHSKSISLIGYIGTFTKCHGSLLYTIIIAAVLVLDNVLQSNAVNAFFHIPLYVFPDKLEHIVRIDGERKDTALRCPENIPDRTPVR